MALAHVTPGYGDYLGSLEHSKRASKLLDATYLRSDAAGLPSADYTSLVQLRDWAKRQWSSQPAVGEETTYGAEFGYKNLLEPTRTISTERDRRNRPHPPTMFMTNHLHYVPGYHNADSTLDKEPYRVDLAVSADERRYRDGLKDKFNGTRTAAAIRQFEPFDDDAGTSYGSAGRLPYHSEKDRAHVRNTLGAIENPGAYSVDSFGHRHIARRHLDMAGPDERSTIEGMLAQTGSASASARNLMIPHGVSGTTRSRRQDDIATLGKVNKPLYRYLQPRGDFLIHPVWPPTLRHHHVPGFVV